MTFFAGSGLFVVRSEFLLSCLDLSQSRTSWAYSLGFLFKIMLRCSCGSSLWSSGHSSWLQMQTSEFESRRYQILWEVVGLERGPLSLVSTIEELFGWKSSGPGLEIREYGRRDKLCWPRDTPLPAEKLALTSPTRGGRSVGIVGFGLRPRSLLSFVCYVVRVVVTLRSFLQVKVLGDQYWGR
jgi:hypothetical protein